MNQTELLDQFILEARDCLEQAGQRLLEVEKNPDDKERLNDLFRMVHTLKGNCGLFEFKALETVVHAGEDLLDRVRNGTLGYNDVIADALLEAMDFTAQMVDEIEKTGQIAVEAAPRSQALSSRLRALLEPGATVSTPRAPVSAPAAPLPEAATASPLPSPEPVPPWVDALPPDWRSSPSTAVAWRYSPEPECFFKGEDPWLLARQVPGLLHLKSGTQAPWADLSTLDCYRCNLAFAGISSAPVAYLHEHFRYVPEQVEFFELSNLPDKAAATSMQATVGSPANAAMSSAEVADTATASPDERAQAVRELIFLRTLQIWEDQLIILGRPSPQPGVIQACRLAFKNLLHTLQELELPVSLQAQSSLAAINSVGALVSWAQTHRPSLDHPVASADTVPAAGGGPLTPDNSRRGGGGADDGAGHNKVLKVGQEKIDRLMDLIGEMVVAKNALPYLAQRAESVFQQRELAREIKAQYAVINRIAEDMQHAIMQVRMMPVGTVFQRFGRLVRDISKKLGKDVQLVVEGEDTEADKNVIEALADPLIHILRNSLDHGIELPEVRRAAGKPEQGTIKVVAHQESDRVFIEISDDGAGVNPTRVRDKAVERGLIPADKAATLSDAEAVQLIFLPGFSTAESISDLSGRGVGMDVVRTAVERINGHVDLQSTQGKGTRIRLSLPLSMAVTNVMIIEAGNRRFGVPMDLIVETVRVHADDIHHFKQARTTVLRGRIVPLRALHDLLALDESPLTNEDGEHAVLVVRLGSENVGLLVDHFHGATDIILKPLEGVLSGLTGFAGTALMGDGGVLMILNPKELV